MTRSKVVKVKFMDVQKVKKWVTVCSALVWSTGKRSEFDSDAPRKVKAMLGKVFGIYYKIWKIGIS